MKPYYEDASITLWHGDCLHVLRSLPDASVDAVVTDPPYGLGFMGREWDSLPPGREWATECLRVLKPGGHLLAFGGTRTWHRLACAVEDAGFEVRDSIAWMYGSGFPKSLDVSKAIDKAARGVPQGGVDPTSPNHGKYRTTTTEGKRWDGDSGQGYGAGGSRFLTDGTASGSATEPAEYGVVGAAADWQGWGTALKPAFEPVVVARKPLEGTVAANVLAHGTGALNIDATRLHTPGSEARAYTVKRMKPGATLEKTGGNWRPEDGTDLPWEAGREYQGETTAGRWPANVILDESQAEALDEQSGELTSGLFKGHRNGDKFRTAYGDFKGDASKEVETYGDSGGASRFFYVAKAGASERPRVNGTAHPTVKPLDLMRWLVRLVTPPGGTVLEPFAGSGTTVEACIVEGFHCIAIEREADYLPLITQRINRRRNPVAYIEAAGEDLGLFNLEGEPA